MSAPKLCRDWIGRTVRNRTPLSNQLAEIPAGRMFVIKRAAVMRGGWRLESDPCPCCGVAAVMNVHSHSLRDPKEFDWIKD